MLARTLIWVAVTLIAIKLFWPTRWREVGRSVNRVVNATFVAIVLVYSAWLLIWWLKGP